MAKHHIEGKINIDEAQRRIQSYYEELGDRTEIEAGTKEADIVSARIAKLLGIASKKLWIMILAWKSNFPTKGCLCRNRWMHVDYRENVKEESQSAKIALWNAL